MTGRQKYDVVKQIVGYEKSFASTPFTKFGTLYYALDLPNTAADEMLCVNEDGADMKCPQVTVGPTNNRMFSDDGRETLDVDRGPWRTAEDYVLATARREIASIMELSNFPKPQDLFYGPGQYRPASASKLSALAKYLKVAHHLLPKEAPFQASIMWHGDVHTDNMFVRPENPTEIVGIIDWQSVHLSPLFLQARHPAPIGFNGPIPKGFELPENFDELSPAEQKEAKLLRSAQSLYKLYEVELRKQNEVVFRALQYQETLACKITALAGSLFSDGEPIVNGMLTAVEKEWLNVVGTGRNGQLPVPCPLIFSFRDTTDQPEEEAIWVKGVELMEAILEELGVYRGWDGWVNHANYATMKDKLEDCLERFLSREAKNDEERAEWIKAWPFKDSQLACKGRT